MTDTPFPATTKRTAGEVKGVLTDVMTVGFADKIVVTIVQNGRLAQWFHVGLDAAHRVLTDNAVEDGANDDFDDSLLPLPHLTPVTLLGGTDEKREATGQLLTVQIASLISARNKDESRMVTVGLGLGVKELDQQAFMEILELVGKCV
ncbi:hypothetical protein EX30DRAFT_328792 [Ascodesmis nigricans]|uniref:Proteasome assembly chaperone 3 n=1 Tax=Ascodesmis nigricans TaxID=341454 RepID=A0A4S2N1A5_9PEZI|nr:hypothetical protein EX30DRAFT_328792 [Ascodesmis nigricans]